MITRLFHAWEHRLASSTTNRVVRPFEWGLDWRSNGNGAHPDPAQPEELIGRWIDEAMRDSQAFFTPSPTADFEFEPASDARRRQGEAGTLRFPSALVTPHPTNNVVAARWFPARGEAPPGAA